jgi:hypothetical protein
VCSVSSVILTFDSPMPIVECSCEELCGGLPRLVDAVSHRALRASYTVSLLSFHLCFLFSLNSQNEIDLLGQKVIAATLADDPMDISTDPVPLDSAEVRESLSKLNAIDVDGTWFSNSERKALKSLFKIGRKVQDLYSSLLENIDDSERLEAVSQSLVKAGKAAGKYLTHSSSAVVDEANEVLQRCGEASNRLLIIWEDYEARVEDPTSPLFYDTGGLSIYQSIAYANPRVADHIHSSPAHFLHPIALFIGLVGLVTHCFTNTGVRFADFLFGSIKHLLKTIMQFDNSDDRLTERQGLLIAQTPHNLKAALAQFGLGGRTEVWAVCPDCKYTHKPSFSGGIGRSSWPSHCQYADASGVTCGRSILKQRGHEMVPIRPFLVPSLPDYLGRLLSDPDIEKMCNDAVDNAGATEGDERTSVFTSPYICQFKDRDGALFLQRGNRIRLLFTLHYDQFNSNGVRVRGSSASIGVINLALLNLPPSLRYLPEHLFMTLIPGPDVPRGHELNHFLRPIVDQLVVAWDRSIMLSRTGLQRDGAVVDLAVAYMTSDLVAARHLAGLGGTTSNWLCSVCKLFGRQNVWNINWSAWPRRDSDEMRMVAEQWRDASSEKQRDEIFNEHGVRWSKLWRLPYYEPTKNIVVDPMHCLLLGIVLFFVRFVLGLQSDDASSSKRPVAFRWDWEEYWDADCDPGFNVAEHEVKMVPSIHRLLERPITDEFTVEMLKKRLSGKNLAPLRFVAHSLELSGYVMRGDGVHQHRVLAQTKPHFVELLIDWVRAIL